MMTYFARFCGGTALALVLTPHSGLAEVTADDVWRNQKDYMAVFGGDFVASADRVGNTLTISDASLAFEMPFNLGSVTLALPDHDLVDNGDGTVAVIYPDPVVLGIAADITGKGSFLTNFEFDMQAYKTVASGEPKDVTYTWSLERMDMRAKDTEIDFQGANGEKLKDFQLTLQGSFYDMAGVTRIKIGKHVEIENAYSTGLQEIRFNGGTANEQINHVSGSQSMVIETLAVLPRNGMDIMNLAAAVQDGLALEATMLTKGSHSSEINLKDGTVVSEQSTRAGEQSVDYELGQAGLRMDASVLNAELDVKPGNALPFSLQLHVEKAGANVVLPLSASSELQGFTFAVSLEGLKMADDLWALLDPQEKLPRDLANVTTDFTGKVLNKINWLDFLTVKQTFDQGEVPVEIHEVTLGGLLVEMAGAKLTGSGAASFDNSDLASRGGIPKPSGVVDLVLSGGNGLLDNLVAMGLISDQDAMGARMAVAVFTLADPEAGEDVLKSRLEMTEEGHILANGQRIQ